MIKAEYFKNIIAKIILMIASIVLLTTSTVSAKDFGKNAHTYNIKEGSFLKMIEQRLQKVDIEKERLKMIKIAKDRVNNPIALKHITPATEDRIFLIDPTYIVKEDIILPCAKILHKAGTTVNPLDHMDFDRRLIFIDAREKKQVKWLQRWLAKNTNHNNDQEYEEYKDKVILVAGSPLKLSQKLNKQIYFDQKGALTKYFNIQHSPAVIEQDGKKMKVTEIKL